MADGLQRFGSALQDIGLGFTNPAEAARVRRQREFEQQDVLRKEQNLQNLQNALNPPEFLRANAQQAFEQGDTGALARLDHENRENVLSAFSAIDPKSAALQGLARPQQRKAQSATGKVFGDIRSGAIPPEFQQQAINRAFRESRPLVSIAGEQGALAKKRGQARGDREALIDDAATQASSRIGQLDILEQEFQTLGRTGATIPLETAARNIAQSLGIKLTDKDEKNLATAELVDSINKDIAASNVKRLGANPSNIDLKLQRQIGPELGKSLAGNLKNIDLQRARSEFALGIQGIKDENLDGTQRELNIALNRFKKTNPISTRYNELQAARSQRALPTTTAGQTQQPLGSFSDRLRAARERRRGQ